MFKKIIAITLLFSFSAQAYDSDLTCFAARAKSSGKENTSRSALLVEKGLLDATSEEAPKSYLLITNNKGLAVSFAGPQVDEIKTRYHRVILANNDQVSARIIVNQAGQADVSVQKSDGTYLVLRQIVNCPKN